MIYSEKYRSDHIRFGSKYYSHLSAKLGQHFRCSSKKSALKCFLYSIGFQSNNNTIKIEREYEMFRKIPAQNQKQSDGKPNKHSASWLRGASMAALLLVSVVLIFVMLSSYYAELDNQLFAERSNHLQEITEKVADIFDITIARSWDSVNTLEQFLFMENTQLRTEDELMQRLKDTSRFRASEGNIFLLLDDDFRYYASDGSKGYWRELPMIIKNESQTQELITTLPYQNSSLTYLCFLKQLPEKLVLEATGKSIAYVMLAVDIHSINDGFSIDTFGSSSYTYIVNRDGRALFVPDGADSRFKAYNIVNALEDDEFIHGGTLEDFRSSVRDLESAVMEFSSDGTDYFVSCHSVGGEGWNTLMLVPTSVLGDSADHTLGSTRRFFIVLGVLLIIDFSALVFYLTDNRNRKLMEQKEESNRILKEAAEEARSANKAKSEFLSHMSHDIRTPINGIMGMTEIALKNVSDAERVEDCLGKITNSSQHLLSLINDVLDMSRIESGKVTLNSAPMNMSAATDECASIISGQLLDRSVEFIREFGGFAHPNLIGDELHLRQVLINILGNSVKFTPDGGKIYFRVKETGCADGKARFRFEIEDTGIGMKPEFLKHIWEPFSQEDGGNRTNYKGTGLGMAITKQFVDMMGGTVTVESQLNVGSKFVIELGFDIDTSVETAAEMSEKTEFNLEGMRVMLVEDNEINTEIASFMLEEVGITVTCAENGKLAVEIFQNSEVGSFDVILMDIMMPVMNGLDAARAIRALDHPDAKTIPIVAMTANAYDEDVRNAHEAGMNGHLAKPIDTGLLYRTLDELYHSPKA